jgi:hypothetical protein
MAVCGRRQKSYDHARQYNQCRFPLRDAMHKYGEDYKVIVAGDASMSQYEITHPDGALGNTARPSS